MPREEGRPSRSLAPQTKKTGKTMEKKGQKRNKKNDLERKVEKLQLTADDRETRGFISMICTSPSAGLTAICTLEPPHSTPISRMMATEASRRRWYSCGWLCVGGSEEFVFFQREKERAGELFELFFFLFSFSFHPFHFPLSLSLSLPCQSASAPGPP